MSIKLSNLMNAVCTIRTFDGRHYHQGQGVFLGSDVVLTARHCVMGQKKIEVIHDSGTAELLKGSPFNKASETLDVALMQIVRPLKADAVRAGGTDEGLLHMKGWLVTRFTGQATYHSIGIDLSRASSDLESRGRRSFMLYHKTIPGYSGSPIFDSTGRLASLLLGRESISTGSDFLLPPEGLHSAWGPHPEALGDFIRTSLRLGR